MANFSRILCVIDPTEKVQPALQRAAWLAKHSDAKLDLLICYYDEYMSGERFFDSKSLEKARVELLGRIQTKLDAFADPIRAEGVEVSTTTIWDHPLHEGIVRQAKALEADVVFKDTHHHSVLSRSVFSNTDWNLIRTCPVPLWLVKPVDLGDSPLFLAAVDPLNEHDKPAELDARILTTGNAIAKDVDGEVHVFHAFDPVAAMANATGYAPISILTHDIEDQMREEHRDQLNAVAKSHGISENRTHLAAGRTNEELPALAKKLDAAVVIMGAVSRNKLKRIFIGATAETTLEHLPCDLLIIKPKWFHSHDDAQVGDAA